jgi:hypothetical protein
MITGATRQPPLFWRCTHIRSEGLIVLPVIDALAVIIQLTVLTWFVRRSTYDENHGYSPETSGRTSSRRKKDVIIMLATIFMLGVYLGCRSYYTLFIA